MHEQPQCSIGIFLSTPVIEQYVAEYQALSPDVIHTSRTSFDDAVAVAKDWERQGVEVFISRRGTGEMLRRSAAVPVLSLPISEMEILRTLKEGTEKGMRVLMTMYNEKDPSLDYLGELLGIKISQRTYRTRNDLETVIRKAAGTVDKVAGGSATSRLALRYGLAALELTPSREQVINVLESARNVAASKREKEALVSELRCMMDSMSDGILSLDREGNVLSVNDAALKLLRRGAPEAVIGQSFVERIGRERLQSVLEGNRTDTENMVNIHGATLLLNIAPIKSTRGVERLLVTLRKSQDVIRQSGAIRSFISRGFVAHYKLQDVLYRSRPMREVIDLCNAYAKTDASVLIYGETGTGKEMLSQGIHNRSARSKGPFVSVNCAELPEHLLESELFGYNEGAFTGSSKGGKAGFFELAHTGTIFLDEIDSASASVQSKLLRVLQEKEIMRIGGNSKIPVDVRVLATSGRDLWELVRNGQFRKDLFFRLNVMSIRIPPLRQRIEDLDILLPHFLDHFSAKEKIPKPILRPKQIQLLKEYDWPGNTRQLRHFAERYVLYSGFMTDPFTPLYNEFVAITLASQPESAREKPAVLAVEISAPGEPASGDGDKAHPPLPHDHGAKKPLDDPDALQALLSQVRYSKKEAARMLGVSRSTLWRRMKQLNLE